MTYKFRASSDLSVFLLTLIFSVPVDFEKFRFEHDFTEYCVLYIMTPL